MSATKGYILVRTTPELREALKDKAHDARQSLSAFLLQELKTLAEK
jgi:predicted HicB family RNase H-like nuclease